MIASIRLAWVTALCVILFPGAGAAAATDEADQWLVVPSPADSFSFAIFRGDTQLISTQMRAWGPDWTPYVGFGSRNSAVDGDALVSSGVARIRDILLACRQRVCGGGRAVAWQYELSAEEDCPLTMFSSAWTVPSGIEGELELISVSGVAKTHPFRMGKGGQDQVVKAAYKFKQYGVLTLSFDPPTDLAFDDSIRVKLASDLFPAGSRTVKVVLTADASVRFVFKPEDRDALNTVAAGPDWYPLEEVADLGPSVIGMENWLHKPAGAGGHVRIVGDRLELGDGSAIKFWGTNLCYETTNPPQAEADSTAARFAKYGINCVRFHKFLERGVGDKNDGTQLDPAGLARMDYFTAALARNGVYYAFSPFFGFRVGPGNKDRLLAYDEVIKLQRGGIGNAYALINYAEDIQDLVAEMYTNLLTHKNPHTGKTYAEDPALASVEIQNEDDIFWGIDEARLSACPTYARRLEGRFADWLKAKYGSQEKLKAAWEKRFEARGIAGPAQYRHPV